MGFFESRTPTPAESKNATSTQSFVGALRLLLNQRAWDSSADTVALLYKIEAYRTAFGLVKKLG
ncbi:hypothetical protein [Nocardia cyriacigeorgica]|uniref:hypothetical protein n=1 Tax=Nocardia cyriacigeorgica TaxID=135487 RepID=UPI0026D1CB78